MDIIQQWQTVDRKFTITRSTFVKRTLNQNELLHNLKGEIIIPWKDRRYLENECAALKYIAENTTIPVPKILDFSEAQGALVLTVERIRGVPLDNISSEHRDRAIHFVEENVLPQLQKLKSNRLGGLTGQVLVSERIRAHTQIHHWPSKTNVTPTYVFCHGDLAQHNILVDPETFEVIAIIDWENSGFFPAGFETPLWLQSVEQRATSTPEVDCEVDGFVRFLSDPEWLDWPGCSQKGKPEEANMHESL